MGLAPVLRRVVGQGPQRAHRRPRKSKATQGGDEVSGPLAQASLTAAHSQPECAPLGHARGGPWALFFRPFILLCIGLQITLRHQRLRAEG